jgi:hypothetical protein
MVATHAAPVEDRSHVPAEGNLICGNQSSAGHNQERYMPLHDQSSSSIIPYAEGAGASQRRAEAQGDLGHCQLSVCRYGSCRGCRNFSPAPGKLLDWLSHFNQPAVAAFQMLGRFSGVLHLALGIAAVATGLLHGRSWAW